MPTHQFQYSSAAELLAALTDKQVSSLELVDAAIARIVACDEKINAVVVKDFERARAAARAADAARARGEHRPLLGLPLTVKESFNVTGLPTTWGNPEFKNWHPAEDALVVARLKSAGAIILGKTNVPFMLNDWQSYNDIYGVTNNPWNVQLTAGGSSGGSAAALAMGYVALELGSDLAGSLRVPAHFCGVCAHKPSADLVPFRGSGPPKTPSSSMRIDFVVPGPMARTASDLALGLQVVAGPDELADGIGYQLALPQARKKQLREFRVLMLDEHPLYPTASAIKKAQQLLAERLQQAGVTVARTCQQLPDLAAIAKNYALLLGAWYSVFLTDEIYAHSGVAVKKLSESDDKLENNFLRGMTMNHRDWMLAAFIRESLRAQWRELYREFDVVLCPAAPTVAFAHDHSENFDARKLIVDGVSVPYADQYIWASIATLFGLPATVIPIDRTNEGLPVGIQIIGDYLQDMTTLEFANLVEKNYGGFIQPSQK